MARKNQDWFNYITQYFFIKTTVTVFVTRELFTTTQWRIWPTKKNNTLMTYANNCSLDLANDYFERRFSLIFKDKTLTIPTWSKVVNTFDRIPNYILTNDARRRF